MNDLPKLSDCIAEFIAEGAVKGMRNPTYNVWLERVRALEANQRTEWDFENERLRQSFGEHWRKDGGSDGSHWDAQDIVSILRDAIERRS